MSTTTPDQQITIPQGTDLADVVAMIASMVAGVETRLNLRYTNAADRTARHPVGIENEISALADVNRITVSDGVNWVSHAARGYHAFQVRSTNAVPINNSIGLVGDSVLTTPIDAGGNYVYGGALVFDSATAADIRVAAVWPAAAANTRFSAMGRNITTNTNIDTPSSTVSGTPVAIGSNGVGTIAWLAFTGVLLNPAAGNLQIQYAQQVADVSDLTVRAGSHLWAVRYS